LTWPVALTTVQHYRADCDLSLSYRDCVATVGLIAEVGIADVLMSLCDKHDDRAVEAGQTLTRQAIL